jgi:solute carrier family 45 protein 1/2/4
MQSNDINERTTLLRRNSLRVNYEAETGETPKPMAGGTVLGIHNLAIVFPQFIVSRLPTRLRVNKDLPSGRHCRQLDFQGC